MSPQSMFTASRDLLGLNTLIQLLFREYVIFMRQRSSVGDSLNKNAFNKRLDGITNNFYMIPRPRPSCHPSW